MPKSNALLVPTNVKPVKYQLTLEPNMEAFTFKGQESIDIEILEPTDSITLNSVEIVVQSAKPVCFLKRRILGCSGQHHI